MSMARRRNAAAGVLSAALSAARLKQQAKLAVRPQHLLLQGRQQHRQLLCRQGLPLRMTQQRNQPAQALAGIRQRAQTLIQAVFQLLAQALNTVGRSLQGRLYLRTQQRLQLQQHALQRGQRQRRRRQRGGTCGKWLIGMHPAWAAQANSRTAGLRPTLIAETEQERGKSATRREECKTCKPPL